MRLVYSYYVLDIIHRGHLLMLKNAKKLAGKDGKLIVGILTDEAVMERKSRPILSFDERMAIAEAIKYVDIVVPQETYKPFDNIRRLKPNILLESASHKEKDIKEAQDILDNWKGKVITMPYYPLQSSSDIKRRIKKWKKK